MPNAEKVRAVAELSAMFKDSTTVVFADYRGLNVKQLTELRRALGKDEVTFKVIKNNLAERAAQEAGISDVASLLVGPTAAAFGADVVAPARGIMQFAKLNKDFVVKGGVLEGRAIDASAVQRLAELPSREQLLAMVAGAMAAPLSGMASVLAAPIRKLGYALSAVAEQRTAQGA